MFLDYLGHNFKDFIIILFIIFTIILSIYILILNSNLHWWYNNSNISKHDKKKHKPNDIPMIISSTFISIVGLTIIYSFYKFIKKSN